MGIFLHWLKVPNGSRKVVLTVFFVFDVLCTQLYFSLKFVLYLPQLMLILLDITIVTRRINLTIFHKNYNTYIRNRPKGSIKTFLHKIKSKYI